MADKQKSKNRDWVAKRVDHLIKKNPDMDKSKAFQVAWNQCYASGQCKGKRPAKSKKTQKKIYKKSPSQYEQKPNPKSKKKKADLFDGLIALANELDISGHEKTADYITEILEIALKK